MIENPIILCTPAQLAFEAWQTARLIEPQYQTLNPRPITDADFIDAWERWSAPTNPDQSLWEICVGIWRTANPRMTANESDERLTAWWQTIIEKQPIFG